LLQTNTNLQISSVAIGAFVVDAVKHGIVERGYCAGCRLFERWRRRNLERVRAWQWTARTTGLLLILTIHRQTVLLLCSEISDNKRACIKTAPAVDALNYHILSQLSALRRNGLAEARA